MKNLNYPFLIVFAFTFYLIGALSTAVGKETPMHYNDWSLPLTGFIMLNALFFFGYLAALSDQRANNDTLLLPYSRTNWEKIKSKTSYFWATIIIINAFVIIEIAEIGEKVPARTYSWELPLMALVVNGWLFGAGYVSRTIELKKLIKKHYND